MEFDNEALESLLAPICAEAGAELFDVELRRQTLLVTIDRTEGLDLDAVAEVARRVSDALDANESLLPAAPFELEVSSPGVERRLRRPGHFARAIGELVALRTNPGVPGERRLEGVLVSADDASVEIELQSGRRRLAYDEIERAHTVFDWRAALRAPAAGARDGAVAGSEVHDLDDLVDTDDSDDLDEVADELDDEISSALTPRGRGVPTTKERQSR